MTNSTVTAPSSQAAILNEIGTVGRDLAASFGALLQHLPGAPDTPTQVAETLNLNRALAHRLLTAVRHKDPLATAHAIPGPDPLVRVIQAMRRRGAPADLLHDSRNAVAAFRKLIKTHGRDRSGLDALITASLPAARAGFESVAKQSMYRGARQLKGVAADVQVFTAVLHPGHSGVRHDVVKLRAYLGLQLVRPGARLKLGTRTIVSPPIHQEPNPPRTLDGAPVEDLRGVLLSPFCSGPPLELQVRRSGDNVDYMLDWGDAIGSGSARDVVIGEVRQDYFRRSRSAADTRTKTGFVEEISLPTRVLICDLILHEQVYPDVVPSLRVLELGILGGADVNDETREADVLDITERIDAMGRGVDAFRAAEVPNYVELLNYVCGKMGWNAKHFRGYRARIEYPIFGTQLQLALAVPTEPESSGTDGAPSES